MRYLCVVPFFATFYIVYFICANFLLLETKEKVIEYDPGYGLSIEPKSCKDKKREKFILFYTPITQDERELRDVLRTTSFNQEYYSKIDVDHVFVVGTSERNNGLLEYENVTNRDILQSTLSDGYRSLTMKNVVLWEWLEENCYHADYVMKIDSDVLINPFILEDYILSMTDSGTAETLRGFIYPERLRKVHRDPTSKFYLDKTTYNEGVYPIYPAGGAYLLSTPMVYRLLKLMRKYKLYSFPYEDVANGLLLSKENMSQKIMHARSFNLDGVVDLDDQCNFDFFAAFNLCPDSCNNLVQKYASYFEQITSPTHYSACDEIKQSPSAQCYHQSYCVSSS